MSWAIFLLGYLTPLQALEKERLVLRYERELVQKWRDYYAGKGREVFYKQWRRGEKYRPLVQNILSFYKVPRELYYVALIESGFNLKAKSKAGAVGPWQFMKATAKRYGLRVDKKIDERRSIIKSTHAAAKYLTDLFHIFGKWELALLAYNKGEYGLIRAIRKGRNRDYIDLTQKNLLPRETKNYIPKVIAARMMARIYGRSEKIASLYSDKKIIGRRYYGHINLKSIAKQHGQNFTELKSLNTDLLRSVFNGGKKAITLYFLDQKKSQKLAKNLRARTLL